MLLSLLCSVQPYFLEVLSLPSVSLTSPLPTQLTSILLLSSCLIAKSSVALQSSACLELSEMLATPDPVILPCLFPYLFCPTLLSDYVHLAGVCDLLFLWSALWQILSPAMALVIIRMLMIPSHDFFLTSLLLLNPIYPEYTILCVYFWMSPAGCLTGI